MRKFCGVLIGLLVSPALAGSHLWQVNELFSNADGTIQFVELACPEGANAETHIIYKFVFAEVGGGSYEFPDIAWPPTGGKKILLATPGFAALPGAPTPDHIIEENFFDLEADTVRYHLYPMALLTYTSGKLPLDGVMSLGRDGVIAVNSPTNYADETGTVDADPDPPVIDDPVDPNPHAVPTITPLGMVLLAISLVLGLAYKLRTAK